MGRAPAARARTALRRRWLTRWPRLLGDRAAQGFFDLTAIDIAGEPHPFSQYQGNVVLAVNVATD
jgi:hypothetical protein